MCDTLCALGPATTSGVTLFAKNSDRPPDEPQDLEWHPPRRDRGPLATTYTTVDPHPGDTHGVLGSRPRWMWGMEQGVNDAGVAIGNEAVWTRRDPRGVPAALVGMDLVRLALERAATAAAAVDVIVDAVARYGQGGAGHDGGRRPYWSSFLVADPTSAVVVETSGPDVAVEPVERTRAISNRLTIEAFAAEHALSSPVISSRVDPRLAASQTHLEAPATVDGLRSHLRTHDGSDEGWTVCMHTPEEATTAGMVAELSGRAPIAHVVAGQPCRSIFVPVVVGESLGPVPAWERLARGRHDPVHAPLQEALRALEAELAASLSPDPSWNGYAFGRLDAVLAAHGR